MFFIDDVITVHTVARRVGGVDYAAGGAGVGRDVTGDGLRRRQRRRQGRRRPTSTEKVSFPSPHHLHHIFIYIHIIGAEEELYHCITFNFFL